MRGDNTAHGAMRWLMPGLAFKAVVIGGGYATGRELVAYFMPSGPKGGLYAMATATLIWSLVCSLTFMFAVETNSLDYKTFFSKLLGRAWVVFEVAYFCALIVILAVFAAAAGAICAAVFGWPDMIGALLWMVSVAAIAAFGNTSVERMFKWVSLLLYGTYATFFLLAAYRFAPAIGNGFSAHAAGHRWFIDGLTYAGYNIIGAIVILPATRHLRSRRDALVAGLLAGPLAMLPAIAFFVCMVAFYPTIASETLPADFMLGKLQLPLFRTLFQMMIFAALLESGTGGVHAINERIAHANSATGGLPRWSRLAIGGGILLGSVFIAGGIGLVALIAEGLRYISYVFLAIYVLPLLTLGVFQLAARRQRPSPDNAAARQ